MPSIRIILATVLLCMSAAIMAQDSLRVDSLKRVLETQEDTARIPTIRELYIEYIFVDPEIALPLIQEELAIAEATGMSEWIAPALNSYGIYHAMTSQYAEAKPIYRRAIKLFEELDDQERVSALLNNMSIIHRNLGDIDSALISQMQSLEIKEAIPVSDEDLAASYWNIGNVHGDIHNYEESSTWYRKAAAIYKKEGLESDYIQVMYNIGLNMKETDSLEQALPIFEEALAYYLENNLHQSAAGVYHNLGGIYQDQDRNELARINYIKGMELADQYGDRVLVAMCCRRLGIISAEMGRYNEARQYVDRAIAISTEIGAKRKLYMDYEAMAIAMSTLGDYQTAFEYQKKYTELKSEVMSEENIATMNELEVKYQTEKKEQENIIQKNRIQLLEQEAKIARIERWGLIILAILVALASGFLYYALRQKFMRTKAEKEKAANDLALRTKELTGFTMQLANKNTILEQLRKDISELRSGSEERNRFNGIINTIDINIADDTGWEQFRERFQQVHHNFDSEVKKRYPDVTANDLRLMALMKMNLSSKEIASLLNITPAAIKKARYRLRKKMGLETEVPLEDVIMAI